MQPLRLSVLINNYNYAAYAGEAIESVKRQTRPADELVVVDDGSTDDSATRITSAIQGVPGAIFIGKDNGGQLSAFDEGFSASSGDIIFFLDADDLYEPAHLAEAEAIFREHPDAGFLFCAGQLFGKENRIERFQRGSAILGPSAIRTALLGNYVQTFTSTIAVRRSVLEQFMPFPSDLYRAWVTRADDCIIRGSLLSGTNVYYLDRPNIRYRIHGANNYTGAPRSAAAEYRHTLAKYALREYLHARFRISPKLGEKLHKEFALIPHPTRKQLKAYLKAVPATDLGAAQRLAMRAKILSSYLGGGKG